LKDTHEETLLSAQKDKVAKDKELPEQLKKAAERMEETYAAMSLARAEEVMSLAKETTEQLERSGKETARRAKPFSLLLDKTNKFYQPFALGNPRDDVRKSLLIQLDLIKWHLEKEQIVQASILAREWLVSLVAYLKKKDIINERGLIEGMLNNSAHKSKPLYLNNKQEKLIIDLWIDLRKIRNDLAHGGNNKKPHLTKDLISKMREISGSLEKISQSLNAPAP
jgi:hypothetical protein